MRNEFKPFFKDNFRMASFGMNECLYSTEFLFLGGLDQSALEDLEQLYFASSLYNYQFTLKGIIINSDKTIPVSHDNMTALTCLTSRYEFNKPKFSPEHAYWHPRDFFFYAYMNGTGLIKAFGFLFSWVTSICLIYSILFDSYKTINGQQILATDGKLLTFLVINTGKYNLTKAVCEFILRRKDKKFADYFLVYFGDQHPNYILAKEKSV